MGLSKMMAELPQKLEYAAMLVAHSWQDAYGEGNAVAGAVRDNIVNRDLAIFLADKPPVTKTLLANNEAGTIAYISLSNDILYRILFTQICCRRQETVLDELYPLIADIGRAWGTSIPEYRKYRGIRPDEAGLEPSDVTSISTNTLGNSAIPAGAKSGAVAQSGQNLEMLATLVNILTPEQKAAFMALLLVQAKPSE